MELQSPQLPGRHNRAGGMSLQCPEQRPFGQGELGHLGCHIGQKCGRTGPTASCVATLYRYLRRFSSCLRFGLTLILAK
jgi:hypothetical protein